MGQLKEIFRNKNYLKLFLASFTSQMGSIIGVTALMFYLLDRFSNKPAFATYAELMYSLPTLAVFFIVGVLADRMDRQKIAANCDWISAFLSAGLIMAIWIDWLPLIFILMFIRSAISKFFTPAQQALVQGILTKNDYSIAAGLNQMVGSLFILFGAALGAIVYWNFGIQTAIIIDILSFLISGILIFSCKISKDIRLPNGPHLWKDLKIYTVIKDFKDGLTYIINNKLLLLLIMGFFIFGIINGGLSVMPIFILKYKLAPSSYEEYSVWVSIIFGTGLLIGSLVSSYLSPKLKNYQQIVLGLIFSGIFIGLCGMVNNINLFFIFVFIVAVTLPMVNIGLGGWLPHIVDSRVMGRVQGWISPIMMLSQSVTLWLIALYFPTIISLEALFFIVGACVMLAGLYYLIVLPRFSKVNDTLLEKSNL